MLSTTLARATMHATLGSLRPGPSVRSRSGRCADPCLFHRDDRELADALHASERLAARLDLPRIGAAG